MTKTFKTHSNAHANIDTTVSWTAINKYDTMIKDDERAPTTRKGVKAKCLYIQSALDKD